MTWSSEDEMYWLSLDWEDTSIHESVSANQSVCGLWTEMVYK